MSKLPSLPAEINLQIVRRMFQGSDGSDTSVRISSSRQVDYLKYKPQWSDIDGVIRANRSLRRFALQLWFSLLVLRKTSDLTEGMILFPNLPLWVHRLIISISSTWSMTDLAAFSWFQQLRRVNFAEHNDSSPSQGAFFLLEALQRLPRGKLTHLSCSFADTTYLRSTWPYLGEFPQLQELRLRVCNPTVCSRRPRLTRLAMADVHMPLLEESDAQLMAQALEGFPKLGALYIGVFTISQSSFLLHWGLHESARRNNPQYDPWASDCMQCRTDAMPDALRRAETASLSLAKAAPWLKHIEWLSWFAPMKEGNLAFDVTRDMSNDLITLNPVLYML
ncbi:unnamed protein product [Rhizoctonia solani]|uniref:Uncharacterized protein n=1 Tax=Rhizoctonia solani TaxID=456999 RepID=A0A8H3DM84_9AGAM|nr:unnamed protein product [Rhizoctonia solani]CAE6530083.1 unnamed protein product [Rhizoctonia solani]